MNYDEMSDFEINKAVAEALCWEIKLFHDVVMARQDGYQECVEFDPCNNPSDAWPIILENKIDLTALTEIIGEGEWAYTGLSAAYGTVNAENGIYISSDIVDHTDENPLRCAMIVFLKMKEQENG